MPADSPVTESKLLEEAFARYRNEFINDSDSRQFAPYDHIVTQPTVHISLAAYHEMLRDQCAHIANDINAFGRAIRQLRAWAKILPAYEAEDQMLILMEFVEPVATAALNKPYALRSRFIFSVSHLAHQANLLCRPGSMETDLPTDRNINFAVMQRAISGWRESLRFLSHFGAICDEAYSEATHEFRHKYHHRFPPRFEIGITQTVTRTRNSNGSYSYGFGYADPLPVSRLPSLLNPQHEAALRAFASYSDLAREHIRALYEAQPVVAGDASPIGGAPLN